MWPVAAVVVAFAAIGFAGALRPAPGDSAAAQLAQTRLHALPLSLGEWRGAATEIPAKHLQIAEAQAHLSRSYVRPRDGARVALLTLVGAPGPLGAHTPETCFAGAGYEREGVAARLDLPGGFGSLWRGHFCPPQSRGSAQEVLWGWGDGATWVAASDPRFEFAGRNLLYKLYVTSAAGPAGSGGAAEEFLAALLPALAAR